MAEDSPRRASAPSLRAPSLQDRIDGVLETARADAISTTASGTDSPRLQSLLHTQAPVPRLDGEAPTDCQSTFALTATVRRRRNPPPPASRLSCFSSLTLENKGSVARDHLALERTFLAWLRTSLSFASMGIAITQLFWLNAAFGDNVEDRGRAEWTRRAGKILGSAFLASGIVVLFLGVKRYYEGQWYVVRGKFPASRGTVLLVTWFTLGLSVASLVVVAVGDPR